ncbi:MAG: sigma-70 family RNA polymerase sigma factor [Sediminibacterium sp.]|nr:sigma-70 family RNA polymerase sigma factor [Sediminibacterium sp.]
MIKASHNDITDSALLSRFYADQNKEWLGILLERYTLLLLGVCMKYLKNEEEAKDAVQQIFLKALNELEKYPVTYPKSWLYKIACNHCLMKLRDQKINVPLTDQFFEESDSPEDHLAKELNLTLLADCLSELNKEQQTCITLFYLRKKSYQEIVKQTGFTALQVKSHIQNGKRNLKLFMEKKRTI